MSEDNIIGLHQEFDPDLALEGHTVSVDDVMDTLPRSNCTELVMVARVGGKLHVASTHGLPESSFLLGNALSFLHGSYDI